MRVTRRGRTYDVMSYDGDKYKLRLIQGAPARPVYLAWVGEDGKACKADARGARPIEISSEIYQQLTHSMDVFSLASLDIQTEQVGTWASIPLVDTQPWVDRIPLGTILQVDILDGFERKS